LNKRTIVIINKIRYDLIRYHEVLCHETDEYHFIGTAKYAKGFPESLKLRCKTFLVVEELTVELFDLVFSQLPKVDRLICFSEEDLYLAAVLRERHSIPGPKTTQTKVFRDKLLMKERLSKAVRVPRSSSLLGFSNDQPSVAYSRLADEFGTPFVLKPRLGMSCSGVHLIGSQQEFETVLTEDYVSPVLYEVEEFIPGRMFHVDSFVANREVQCSFVSAYTSPPIDYKQTSMGGILQSDQTNDLIQRIQDVNRTVLELIGMEEGCAHLELFVTPAQEIVFCEIGARIGGGLIVLMIEAATGINLAQMWLRHELGFSWILPQKEVKPAGWIKYPVQPNTRVTAIHSGMQQYDWVVAEEIAVAPGEAFGPAAPVSKRMASQVFVGSSPEEVAQRFDMLSRKPPVHVENVEEL
jgi:hypothetical protein